ncbi:MAG: aminotransferase class I/II-fold pyridoxal phosphate-dependent enzyme [Alphaproteobacteria bacterium]|nr:aminotransferase class I/II-fold pyridoxal phosphate-dependent enzyme [Alphaproteobacteria bacterium]
MTLKVASRGEIDPFIVMDMMRAAAELEAHGREVTHMEVGQPGTAAPGGVIEAARRALDDNRLGYCAALGLDELRQGIARHYLDFYGVEVDPERVIVTTGSSAGFLVTALAVFEHGDRVGLSAPGYPAYRNMLAALGIDPVSIMTTVEDRYQLTPDLVAGTTATLDGLIVTSPCNPTGTMVDGDKLADLNAYCKANGIRLISDEIYHGIDFGFAPATAARFDQAIVVNSFSKYFSMTGWRVGWLVVPEDLVRPMERLLQNLFISTATLSQIAALAAFDCHDELRENVAAYATNRNLLLQRLPEAGFDQLAPVDGAFYVYADIGHMTNDSTEFCHRMLREAGVAATPGVDFDPYRGNRFVRFCFAGTQADTQAAADRLIAWRRRS